MERFSYYENASSDEEDDSDSAIYLQDISGHINLNYDTGYDTLSNQSHSFDTALLTPTQQVQTPTGTLRGNITDTGTLTSNRSGTLRSNTDTLNRNTGTLQSTTGSLKSDTGTLQGSPGTLQGTPGTLQGTPGILRSDTGILKSDQQGLRSDTGTLTSNRNSETKKSANDMSVTSPQLQVIPIQKDIAPVVSLTPQQQQLQQYQQQQAPQSPAFPQQFGFNNNIMADISHSMLSMEQNMKRMQRQMEEQFRAMSMGSPMGPPAMMMPHPMDNFGTFPRIKSPFNPAEQQDDRSGLLSIAGGPRSPAQSTVSTIGPSSVSSLSPPSPSISSSTTTEDPGVIMDRNGKKHLKMQFDMQDFKPEEVHVKKDRNRLEVSALHEEKEPNRVSCRVFHQQYHLPKDVRLTKVDSKFSPDGTLTVESAVKPRHRVKFAMEDGANPPQLAIEPPSPQHSGNTDILVTSYPNGVNGTPPFPVQEKQQRRQKQRDDRQGEVQFKVDNRNRTRELTPEDDYEWPDYQPPKVDHQSQKVDYPQRHDQHQQQQHMEFPPQRNDYQSHRPEYQQQQQREQPRVEFQQPPRKDYTPPHSDFQVQQPVRNDYKHKTKSLDRRQVQRQNSARLKDYQQEDAYVRGLELSRQPELGEGVAQVYVSNTPSTMDRPMSADQHHTSATRSYGTLNRSRSPPKPPKRTDSSRYNTLPNRKLASDGQSQRIHDGFTSLQRPPPPNYHQLSYLQLNGDVSPAPSSSSGSTVATAYNTYYHPHHGHHHHRK